MVGIRVVLMLMLGRGFLSLSEEFWYKLVNTEIHQQIPIVKRKIQQLADGQTSSTKYTALGTLGSHGTTLPIISPS